MSEDQKILAVVDDHPIVIEGIKHLLKNEPAYSEVLSFMNAASFLAYARDNAVDIILLDIMLPDADGVDVCKSAKELLPDACVLGMSNQSERSTVMNLLQNGASGYILKSTAAEEILDCIQTALRGEVALCREIRDLMVNSLVKDARQLPALTKREKQLLKLLAEGKTTAMIAEELFLSRFTIDTYRKNLLQKFNVKNTTELLMLVTQEKLL